jgi:hypothetical protein
LPSRKLFSSVNSDTVSLTLPTSTIIDNYFFNVCSVEDRHSKL